MQTRLNSNAILKNLSIALVLTGNLIVSHTAAAAQASLTKNKQQVTVQDTLKMTVGVPLKPQDISPLLAGEQIPVLRLPKATGEMIDLNRLVAESPTILVFYRGGWCPYCSKQLSALQEIEKDLVSMGYQLVAISTDSPENLAKTMVKEKLSYTLLSDADLNAAKGFGIAFKSPKSYDSFLPQASGGKNVDKLLPVPSVFILNKKGMILFEYINPNITQRLSGPLLKAAAGALREEI